MTIITAAEMATLHPELWHGNPGYPGQTSYAGTPTLPLNPDRVEHLDLHTKTCADGATGLVALAETVDPHGFAFICATYGPDGDVEEIEPWYWARSQDGITPHVRRQWQREALGLETR